MNSLKMSFNDKSEAKLVFPDLIASKSCSGRFRCGKCDFKTDSEAEMLLHSINHSVSLDMSSDDQQNDDKLSNQTNGKNKRYSKRKKSVNKCEKWKKNRKYLCPCCELSFSRNVMKKHIYIHTSEKPYKCEECNKEYSNVNAFNSHNKIHHQLMEREICPVCGTSFVSKKKLLKHQTIHEENRLKSHLCDVCGVAFYDKESLKAHTFRLHLPKNARKFKCTFDGCRYSCLYQHQLHEHQKVHSDDKPFACDQCQYTAKSKWTFKKHYRIHTNERPFKCPHCDYASSLSSNLTRHLRIHTGSKPFKCPYCAYSCNNHENLRKHVLNTKKHIGLYLYNCMHCSFRTNAFSDLRKHIEQTHNDIYTVEEIDRMISSIYHKHEDNTTVIPIETNNCQDSNESIETQKPKRKRPQKKINREIVKMIIINKMESQTDDSDEVILPNNIEDNYYNNIDSNYLSQNNSLFIEQIDDKRIVNKANIQNTSEVIIIDSNVLEAQEICVSEQNICKNNGQIIIAISK